MGFQILLHKALPFLVLESIPLNFLLLYFVLANDECTGRFVTFVLEIFDTGKYVAVHSKCIKCDNEYYLRRFIENFAFYTINVGTLCGLFKWLCCRVGVIS